MKEDVQGSPDCPSAPLIRALREGPRLTTAIPADPASGRASAQSRYRPPARRWNGRAPYESEERVASRLTRWHSARGVDARLGTGTRDSRVEATKRAFVCAFDLL